MPNIFCSEDMTMCQIFFQNESVYFCLRELGELGLVHFNDLNRDVSSFQRKFVNDIRWCEDMLRIVRFLMAELLKESMTLDTIDQDMEASHPRDFTTIQTELKDFEIQVLEINRSFIDLKKQHLELSELKHVLKKVQLLLDEDTTTTFITNEQNISSKDIYEKAATESNLGFLSGVIETRKLATFERLLWRASRGNIFLRSADIDGPLEDPVTGDLITKSVFIIFFQGEKLKELIQKICSGFKAVIYPCPEKPGDRGQVLFGAMSRIEDLKTVINQTQEQRLRIYSVLCHSVPLYNIKLTKIKSIYHQMNSLSYDSTSNGLIGECWCPKNELETINRVLIIGAEKCGSIISPVITTIETNLSPPTYFQTNKFTAGFQAIVDSYGIARYKEVNPAIFTIITFPFLFSIMFGDFGHGIILSIFGIFLVTKNNFLCKFRSNEMLNIVIHGRYIILLMGLFSIYSGLIYNDIFSKSMNIFGSCWKMPSNTSLLSSNYINSISPNTKVLLPPEQFYTGIPYYFGIDPIWMITNNEIMMINSFKMKLSIVIAIVHMLFGIILGILNHRKFKDYINIYLEVIPGIIFFTCLFVYLVVLILIKWVTVSTTSSSRPNILLILIDMILSFTSEIPDNKRLFKYQHQLQMALVVVAFIAVPWMLVIKPIVLYMRNKRATLTHIFETIQPEINDNISLHNSKLALHTTEEHKQFNLGEVIIHQVIHTIEFCLGSISNTASYLRLWALSLAHAQLSDVLWKRLMNMGLTNTSYVGIVMIYFLFAAWAVFTIGILLIMEGLSAFLHALRLHWVEFQNKFYQGTGYSFQPFSFAKIIEAMDQ